MPFFDRTLAAKVSLDEYPRIETTPGEIRTYDPNDTVDDSEYRIGRETLPDEDQEKKCPFKMRSVSVAQGTA